VTVVLAACNSRQYRQACVELHAAGGPSAELADAVTHIFNFSPCGALGRACKDGV
jgi:hypothetical protein